MPAMAQSSPELAGRLDAAIAQWNARIDGAFPDLSATVREITDKLNAIRSALDEQRRLPAALVSAGLALEGLELPTQERDAKVAEAIDALDGLEQRLTAFHVELETLAVQANRALSEGASLADALTKLQGKDGSPVLKTGDVTIPTGMRTQSEAAWAAQNAGLERQIAVLRDELAMARQAGAGVPQQVQDELVQLRDEVAAHREASAQRRIDIPELPSGVADELQYAANDEAGKKRPLGMILVKAGVITSDQLEAALREQRGSWHRHIGAILIDLGFADEITIAQALAAQTKLPFVRLGNERIDRNAAGLLSRQMAHHHTSMPLREELGKLVVAMANPLDLVALEDIQLATNRPVSPVVASITDLRNTIREFYDLPRKAY